MAESFISYIRKKGVIGRDDCHRTNTYMYIMREQLLLPLALHLSQEGRGEPSNIIRLRTRGRGGWHLSMPDERLIAFCACTL